MDHSTSDKYSSSVASDSDSDSSSPPSSKPSTSKSRKMGVDPSLEKYNELFGIRIKNVTVLEAGLGLSNLGKKTISIFFGTDRQHDGLPMSYQS